MKTIEIMQRKEALSRFHGICPICKKPVITGQYAHKIANKEMWRRKYGSFVIDHTLNGEYVCSLACNNSVDVGSSYGNHLEVIADILIEEYRRMWGDRGLSELSKKILAKCQKTE